MNIRCNICGGDVTLSADKTFATCEYCGSTITVPKVSDEQRAAAFNRGNHFRRIGEFDKALASYERILREDDTDAEAHWCAALCRFGIEYVEDPATYEWIPTCHRASFDSFTEDVDYKAALEHSDGLTRRLYQKEAAKIAEVQKGILATSQNEEPYDVFICYKETGEDGQRTKDSILAQDIYYQLTDQGHRVFFSRITLEDKAGSQYEPYIFAALNSAKVMVAVGTKPEHFSAVWVKNEWSRFLALMRKDRSRVLLPCYRDMDPYDLPEQLAVLQSYDMGKIGFIQDLIRGVDKVLNAGKAPQAPAPAPVIIQAPAPVQAPAANHDSAIVMGFMDYEMKKYDDAGTTFRQVLMQDDTCAEAYLGMLLVCEEKKEDSYSYREKYLQHTTPEMSALEKKVCNWQTEYDLLSAFTDMGLVDKVRDILDIYSEPLNEDFLSMYVSFHVNSKRLSMDKSRYILQMLHDRGYRMDPELDYENAKTPLIVSMVLDNSYITEGMISAIVEYGADPNALRRETENDVQVHTSAVYHAIAENSSPHVLRELLESGADPNIGKTEYKKGDISSVTYPIFLALEKKQMDTVAFLLEHGADPNATAVIKQEEWSLLSRLLWESAPVETVKLALEKGADPNVIRKTAGGNSYPAVADAIWHNVNAEYVQILLEHGADPNLKSCYVDKKQIANLPALYCCIQVNSNSPAKPEIVRLLLAHGADIRALKTIQHTSGVYEEENAISSAVAFKDVEIATILLEHGADPNSKRLYRTSRGDAYIPVINDSIYKSGETTMLKLLLEHGADPNSRRPVFAEKSADTYTVLSDSVWRAKNAEMVQLLLKHGADPSILTEKYHYDGTVVKESILHEAIIYAKSQKIVNILVQHGVSLDLPTTSSANGRDIPFRKYPYALDDEWEYFLRNAGWKGPGLFGSIFITPEKA